MKGLYTPSFPEIGFLSKWGSAGGMSEEFRKGILKEFLTDSETPLASKAFGSRNEKLMFLNCDLGWLIVTNIRILFWSDKSTKPHVAIDLKDINSCKSSWRIMKQRSVKIYVNNEKIKFGTHRNAARLIEKLVDKFNK